MTSGRATATAAVITPPGEGGIGIIALAGPGAGEILDAVFRGSRKQARQMRPGSIAHGRIVHDGATVDEVIVARADHPGRPGEGPQFEVNCHGGVAAVQAVLGCLRGAGAQVVPWEQLPRDPQLVQPPLSPRAIRAQALARLPRAHTRLAARMLLHQMRGALSAELSALRGDLSRGEGHTRRLRALLETASLGRALLQPPRVLLAGPPNVGKSSLLNALLRRERVIVHDRPGTTRDVVRETVSIRGVPFELIDSAGIWDGAEELELMAVQKAIYLLGKCEVVLWVRDARRAPLRSSGDALPRAAAGRIITVANKADLAGARGEGAADLLVSAREGWNIEKVEDALLAPYAALIGPCERGGPIVFTDEAERALAHLADVLDRRGPAEALCRLEALTR